MRKHKYGAVRTEVNGISFASKKESRRYSELLLLQKAGEISDLKLQVKMPVCINGIMVFNYVCDFVYWDHKFPDAPLLVYEDVKGMTTPVYRLKKKCVEAYYRTKITET
jgi:uncharacterized protein DUF1064